MDNVETVREKTNDTFHPSPQLVNTFNGHTDFVMSVCFSPDQKKLCSVGDDEGVFLWDLESFGLIKTFKDAHSDRIFCVDYSPDGRFFCTASGDYNICLWDDESTDGNRIKIGKHVRDVNCVRYLHKKPNYILTCSDDETIKLWNVELKKLLLTCETDDEGDCVNCVDISKDNRTVISAHSNYAIKIWDLRSLKCSMTLNDYHVRSVECVQICPNSTYFASGGLDNSAKIFDFRTFKLLSSTEYSSNVHSISFHPSGKYLLSTFGHVIRIFSVNDEEVLGDMGQIQDHSYQVFSVCFSPDGKYIVSGGGDKKVNLFRSNIFWNMRNKNEIIMSKNDEDERKAYLWERFQNCNHSESSSSFCDIFTLQIANRMNTTVCLSKVFFCG